MKNALKTGVVIMLVSSFVSLFSGCSAKNCTGSVNYFSYSHIGSWMDGYSITVKEKEDGNYVLVYTDDSHMDYGEMEVAVSKDFQEKLTKICDDHQIKKWNGFDKSAKDVLDGSGFSLSVNYEGGGIINAHGYMREPRGFGEFLDDINSLCKSYIEDVLENARKEKIARGVDGACNLILAQFRQHGNSGKDVYEILISKSDIRDINFDVKVSSVSGEFFPEGEHRYYAQVPDESLNFEKLAKIVSDLNITKWMDYDQTADDYTNSEWFQIALSFESGEIQASGSEHPDNYDAFRTAVLTWLRDMVEANSSCFEAENK